jgi:hypothetical protein
MLKRDANHRTRFNVEPSSVFFGGRGGEAKAADSFNTKNQRGLVPPRIAAQSSPHVVGQAHDKVDFFTAQQTKSETTKQKVMMSIRCAFATLGLMECYAFLQNQEQGARKTNGQRGSQLILGWCDSHQPPQKRTQKNKGLVV